jgi:hypothetical protein
MAEIITAEQIKFNHAQALVKEAEVNNLDDKAYWHKQAESWAELYTKMFKRVLQ